MNNEDKEYIKKYIFKGQVIKASGESDLILIMLLDSIDTHLAMIERKLYG